MNAAKVLMLDCREDSCQETVFLLRLRGFQVTVVKDSQEMINWFFSQQDSPAPFKALLVNCFNTLQEVEEICFALRQKGIMAPLLLVERQHLPERVRGLNCSICRPGEILGHLSGLFQQHRFLQ